MYLGKVHMAGDQQQQRLPLPKTIAQVDIAELAGIARFVIGNNMQPFYRLFEKGDDPVDLSGVDGTG